MGTKVGLDHTTVIQAAAQLADSEGFAALSLARLATSLEIRTPSLYNYVDGLAGLRRALAIHAYRELTAHLTHAALGETRRAAILAMMEAYRSFIKMRPGLYDATLYQPQEQAGDPDLEAAKQAMFAVVAAILRPYQLEAEEHLHVLRALRSVVHGFATLEREGGFGLPLSTNATFTYLVSLIVDQLENE